MQTTKILLIDDLDGGEADKTISFALDGVSYEIDLSDANAKDMAGAIDRYISAARTISRQPARRGAPKTSSGVDYAAVRAWAKGAGVEVSERGRIKADVIDQYRAAGR